MTYRPLRHTVRARLVYLQNIATISLAMHTNDLNQSIYILNSSSNSHGRNIVVMVLCLSTHCVRVPGPTNNDPRPQLGEIQPRKEHQRDCCSDGDQALPLGHR